MPSTRRRRPLTECKNNVEESPSQKCPKIEPTTELGYFLLSACTVHLPTAGAANCALNQWSIVELTKENTEMEACNNGSIDHEQDAPCPHCNLIVQAKQDTAGNIPTESMGEEPKLNLTLGASQVGRFQGTMADLVHRPVGQDGTRNCKETNRSDAVLLMGSILDAQDHAYLSLQSMHIIVHGVDIQDEALYSTATVSLVTTCAFPALTEQSARQRTRSSLRCIVPSSRRKGNSSNLKPLPSSVQMILSLIRSDWGCLKSTMTQMENSDTTTTNGHATKKKDAPEFFPPRLTLEEVGERFCEFCGARFL